MPVFEYVAVTSAGKRQKGSVDAENQRAARQKLRAQGIFPTEVREASEKSANPAARREISISLFANRVSTKDLAILTRQLATLLSAGLPLVQALQILPEQTESKELKRIIVIVREEVEQGSGFAKALGQYPKAFPRLYINMIASGEASGTLDTVLENLADYLDSQVELMRKVRSSLSYPILMFGFCTIVVIALLTYVVPTIVQIFDKEGAVLPLPTRIVMGISNAIQSYWYLIIALIAFLVVAARWYYRQPHGRERVDALVLKLPLFGALYTKVATSRIARTLGTLLSSGVQLLTAMEISRNIVGNVHMVRAIEQAKEGVSQGRSLAKELSRSGLFPPLLSHMIAVGESSGKLEGMLSKAGKAYEGEVNATLSGLTSIIEPLMMIVMGSVVFGIVISVLLPMVDMISLVQK